MIFSAIIVSFLLVLGSAGAVPAAKCLPGTLPPQNGSNQSICYLFVGQAKSFSDAEAFCKQQNGHLAPVNDAFTDIYLTAQSDAIYPSGTAFWIGARVQNYSNVSQWLWTDRNGVLVYSNWSPPDAGTSPQGGACVSVKIGVGTWSPTPCNTSRPFVCEVPSYVDICDGGYLYNPATGMCYKLVTDKVNMHTFDQAEANCTADGGHLTSIHDDAENTFVSLMAPGLVFSNGTLTMHLYVGGYYNGSSWKWTDGSPWDYHNWYNVVGFVGNGGCTVSYTDGYYDGSYRMMWNDYGCTDPMGRFICKKQPSHVPFWNN